MEYFIKASAVLCIFYFCYILLLQKETFFNANRWFLLSGLLISGLLPFIIIPIYVNETPIQFNINDFATVESTEETIIFNWMRLASVLYGLGVIFFLVRFCIEILSLRSFFKSEATTQDNGFKISETQKEISPFSFFKHIVYNPSQFNETELTHILNHEKIHASQYHSIDILLSKIATIIFWCNPIIWLYKKALIQNLEFIADSKSIAQQSSSKTYQKVLLKTLVPSHQMALTTNFYNSLIKKRILMLNTSKSKSVHAFKYAVIAPLLLAFIMSFNTKTVYAQDQNTESETVTIKSELKTLITKNKTDADLETFKKMFLRMNVDLEITDVKRNASNEIIAISINGKSEVEEINYKTDSNTPISPILISYKNEEKSLSIQVVKETPEVMFTSSKNASKVTTNNKNSFIIPTSDGSSIVIKSSGDNSNKEDNDIMFISDDVKTAQKTTEESKWNIEMTEVESTETLDEIEENTNDNSESSTVHFRSNENEEPLVLVNGKQSTKEEVENIDPNSIEQINVLKDVKATEKYGEEGKYGVIEIILK
ncbi:M56 family metallopeptidase [Formosa sp. L2A11]|uniref:M56 family metallopeptidase n=1 Tax=Formosa sp. L2A11 TaxID=2686363 RepID=UPI00131DFADC|nr:M56 family metallopeptidase [Formosa sp. L2A11]